MPRLGEKFQNAIFHIQNSFHEVTHIGLEPHQFFFFLRCLNKQSLETLKVLAEMGRGWQASGVWAKIFSSNLHRHVMKKCWKFQEDSLILIWFIAEWLKICCNKWTPVVHYHQKWWRRSGPLLWVCPDSKGDRKLSIDGRKSSKTLSASGLQSCRDPLKIDRQHCVLYGI